MLMDARATCYLTASGEMKGKAGYVRGAGGKDITTEEQFDPPMKVQLRGSPSGPWCTQAVSVLIKLCSHAACACGGGCRARTAVANGGACQPPSTAVPGTSHDACSLIMSCPDCCVQMYASSVHVRGTARSIPGLRMHIIIKQIGRQPNGMERKFDPVTATWWGCVHVQEALMRWLSAA